MTQEKRHKCPNREGKAEEEEVEEEEEGGWCLVW